MRFVFAIRDLDHNGPSGSRLRLAEALTARGHEAEILTLSPVRRRDVPAGVKVSTLRVPPASGFLRSRRRLTIEALRNWFQAETERQPIDFLSSSLTGTNRLIHLSGLVNSHHWLHIPISTLRSQSTFWRRWRRRRADRQIYGGARVIGVSQGVIDDLARLGATPSEANLIHNTFDLEGLRRRAEGVPADMPQEPFVVHAARFVGVKRYDVLFEAFKRAQVPHRLVLLTEDKPELRDMIARFGLTERVMVAGFRQNPYPFMARAEALILSSDSEGFPNVLVESLIVGTPVVSTDCRTGPSEILTGPYARWLSPPGDAAALGSNLTSLLKNPYAIEPWLVERFSMDVALDKLEEIAGRGIRPALSQPRLFG